MDGGDMDADEDIDLVLGTFVYFLPDSDRQDSVKNCQTHLLLLFWKKLFVSHHG